MISFFDMSVRHFGPRYAHDVDLFTSVAQFIFDAIGRFDGEVTFSNMRVMR